MDFLINKKHSFDSFIFGSSRIGHISPVDILDGNYYNVTYSGGLPIEHLSNIKLLIKNKIKIKNLIIGLDDFSYQQNYLHNLDNPLRQSHFKSEINNRDQISFYLYYLFKLPSFLDISRLIQQNLFDKVYRTYNYDIYKTGQNIVPKSVEDNIENNRDKHINDKKFYVTALDKKIIKKHTFNGVAATIQSIKEIVHLSQKHDIHLIILINPLNKSVYLDNDLNIFYEFERELVNITNFYDFSGLNKITRNNYYYYEKSHYRDIVGDLIKKRIFGSSSDNKFGTLVTKKNFDQHIKNNITANKLYYESK